MDYVNKTTEQEQIGHEQPHIMIVSQIVRDVKVGGGSRREELAREIGRLRASLKGIYIPGDKLNATFHPQSLDENNVLKVQICAGVLEGSDLHSKLNPYFFPSIPLDINDPNALSDVSRMQLEEVLKYCNDVEIDDGGNPQNMAINACLAGVSVLKNRLKVTILSSSNPFKRLSESVRGILEPNFNYYPLGGIADRIAIQVPWRYESGENGDFALTTEPADTTGIVDQLLSENPKIKGDAKSVNCFVAADPSFEKFRHVGKPGSYCIIVNAATRWRSKIANIVNGTDTILPMNNKEAGDVEQIIEHVGAEEELHNVKPKPFPSPFMSNGYDVSEGQLKQLDDALWKITRYNHLHHRSGGMVAFNCPITFEEEGGLVAGTTREGSTIVAFTTIITPGSDEESRLINEFGDQNEVNWDSTKVIGAGDASATIVAICNAINPQEFIEPFLEGREKDNRVLHQYAQTIFVSAMSRIVGNFLVRTKKCHWSNIELDKFQNLFCSVAKDSLDTARKLFNVRDDYGAEQLGQWGIRVVTWELGSIRNPL